MRSVCVSLAVTIGLVFRKISGVLVCGQPGTLSKQCGIGRYCRIKADYTGHCEGNVDMQVDNDLFCGEEGSEWKSCLNGGICQYRSDKAPTCADDARIDKMIDLLHRIGNEIDLDTSGLNNILEISALETQNCQQIETLPPEMISCTASSEFESPEGGGRWGCAIAFDGNAPPDPSDDMDITAWAAEQNAGAGTWIKGDFVNPITMKELEIMNRAAQRDSIRDVEIRFDGGQSRTFRLKAGSTQTTKITLDPPVPTSTLKLIVKSRHVDQNNDDKWLIGLKEITVRGCF